MEIVLLTLVNILNYLDRYLVNSTSTLIQRDWGLSGVEMGTLISSFVIGYALFSPIFGSLGTYVRRPLLMAFGVIFWSLATFATGWAPGLKSFIAARIAVGIGEASFVTLTPGYLRDKLHDPIKLNRALGWFSAAVPVGAALGYVMGGLLSSHLSWQGIFFVGGAPGLLLALFILRLPEYAPREKEEKAPLKEGFAILLRQPIYLGAVFGYILNTFALNGIAAMISKYGEEVLGFSHAEIDTAFGGILVLTGLFGSVGGSMIASRIASQRAIKEKSFMTFVTLTTFLAAPLLGIAFLVSSKISFLFFCFLAELLVFAGIAPLNSVIVYSVPRKYVSLAQGVTIASINVGGYFTSAPLLGYLSDTISLPLAMQATTAALFLSGIVWGSLLFIVNWNAVQDMED